MPSSLGEEEATGKYQPGSRKGSHCPHCPGRPRNLAGRACPFGILSDRDGIRVQRQPQDLGQVERPAIGSLLNLGTAAEAVGHDEGVFGGGPYRWEQYPLAGFHGDRVVVAGLKAEGAGHAAAAGIQHRYL